MPRLSQLTGHAAVADYSECAALQKRLMESVSKLEILAPQVASARHIREYDGDRKKRILAISAMPFLKAGLSSAAADTEARASETYGAAMKQLGNEFVNAEKVLAEWDVVRIQVDVARSLLSMQRAMTTNL